MIRLDFANMGDPAPQKPQLIGGRSARAEELRNTQDATQPSPVAPLQDLSKPAAPAPPNGAGVSQTAKKAQPVRVTRTKEGTDVKIHYDQIPGLPDDQKEAFKELDKDGSGCVSLNEMLLLAESHTSLQQQVIYLTGAVLTVMVGIFLVSLAAAVLSQTTAATGNALTAPGGSFILNTGTMSQTLPMKYASFLDKAALGRIHTIVINGTALFLPPTTTGGQKRPCGPTCPGVVISRLACRGSTTTPWSSSLAQGQSPPSSPSTGAKSPSPTSQGLPPSSWHAAGSSATALRLAASTSRPSSSRRSGWGLPAVPATASMM